MRIAVTIDDDLVSEIEMLRRTGSKTFNEFVNDILRRELANLRIKKVAAKQFSTPVFHADELPSGPLRSTAEMLAIVEGENF